VSHGLSTGAKAGIGVGVAIGVIILIGVGISVGRRSRKRPEQPSVEPDVHRLPELPAKNIHQVASELDGRSQPVELASTSTEKVS
jgi:hypothetical protein